jgi:dihydroneopterin aldolase
MMTVSRDVWWVVLKDMRFQALVGILPNERTKPQPIEVDLAVEVGNGPDMVDPESLPAIVDYQRLYDAVASILGSGHIDYLEEIAERVAASAFASSDRVTRADVAVRKPKVVLGGPLAYAEVRIQRSRSASGV